MPITKKKKVVSHSASTGDDEYEQHNLQLEDKASQAPQGYVYNQQSCSYSHPNLQYGYTMQPYHCMTSPYSNFTSEFATLEAGKFFTSH
jgi:hypothetical protein